MPAELFNLFPPRRPRPDGDVPADAVAMLRTLAKQAAEAGADPSAAVIADHELLLLCDTIIMLMRRLDEAFEAWQATPFTKHYQEREDWNRLRRALRPGLLRAAKLPALTATGLFAKAMAARRVGPSAAGLAVSLAADLVASPDLRRAIWPAAGER